MMSKSVCVFCGSAPGTRPEYVQAAQAIGRGIAERGWTVVYGGGHIGLMGAVADAALAAGGKVIGIIPQYLLDREVGHRGVTELRVVDSMRERKDMMFDLSDAIVVLPGGFGTLDETAEVTTWAQLGYHHKPILLLNQFNFYDKLIDFVNHMTNEGFIRVNHRDILVLCPDVTDVLHKLDTYHPPKIDKYAEIKAESAKATAKGRVDGASADTPSST